MIIAWPLLAIIGIFFSTWTRPFLSRGRWFQIHRILMICSLVVAVVGVILVFIANKDNDIPGLIELRSCVSIDTYIYTTNDVYMYIVRIHIGLCNDTNILHNVHIYGIYYILNAM